MSNRVRLGPQDTIGAAKTPATTAHARVELSSVEGRRDFAHTPHDRSIYRASNSSVVASRPGYWWQATAPLDTTSIRISGEMCGKMLNGTPLHAHRATHTFLLYTIIEMCVAPPHAESTRRGRTRAETARTQIPERWRSSGEDETPLTSAPPWSSPRPAPARHAAALRNPRGRVLPPWLPPLPPCAPLPAREAPAGRHGRVLGRRWRRR